MTRRPTPVHRSITPAAMRTLPEPTSGSYRRRRWRKERRWLLRWLILLTVAVIIGLGVRFFRERQAEGLDSTTHQEAALRPIPGLPEGFELSPSGTQPRPRGDPGHRT
jgi:hypothetical protein